ncbi:MAG: TonB-dependent receptor [Bacteroidetes bacterium]|nr:TonB-dependent receptor [Bacteroidota bacterium]
MRNVIMIFLCLIGFSRPTFAQDKTIGSVQGKIIDTTGKQNLSQASVSILHVADSSVEAFTVTNKDGVFIFKNLPADNYRLIITFQGYQRIVRRFSVSAEKKDTDFGILYMQKSSEVLEEVIVERPPIQIKEDTVEYNAGSFKVKPNAYAEDLLKKLPGVQVDKDGNVTAQGEQVQKVYVDGKEFFGTDPKLATKNITADMIESVQVFDDMSDQAKFTKIDDGSRQKAINIKLKKDKKKGYFGRAVAGYGTDDRYQGNLSFNRFNEDQRISIIGASNNINQQGFNFSDVVTSMGGFGARNAGGGGGGGSNTGGRGGGTYRGGNTGLTTSVGTGSTATGITKTTSAGINYVDKFADKLQLTSSYFFSHTDNGLQQSTYRQSFFPGDSVANQSDQISSRNINQNHRFNMRLEYALDSMTSILYIPSLTLQHSESSSYDSTYTQAVKNSENYKAINGFTNNTSLRDGINFNNNLLFRKRFKTPGRTITLGWNNTISNSNGSGTNYSPLSFYHPDGSLDSVLLQDLNSSQKTKADNNVWSLSYTEPLGVGKLLEFNYAYTHNFNTSDRKAFNYDSTTNEYDKLNVPQTNYFENGFYANRFGANFRVAKQKYNFQLGAGLQYSELSSRTRQASTGKDTTLKYSFVNIIPTANFNYSFSKTKNLRISYRGHTNQPNITQLQNVADVTNPLQIKLGNPNLKEEFENNFNIRYNSFNPSTFQFISANIILDNTSNDIVNSIDSMGHGIQVIKPVNMNGTFSGSSFVTVGFPLKGKMKGSNINFNNSVSYNRSPSLLYQQKNISNAWTVTQTAGINLVFNDKLNLGLNGSISYNNVTYSVQQNLNNHYFSQTYTADISYTFIKDWILYTDYNQYIISGRSDGYNQAIPLWNESIARQVFKKRNGEIKLSVNDILNQNKSITRTIGDNYILDSRSNVLQRYFMLTFTFNLNRAGINNRNNNGNGPMPRNMQRQMDQLRGNTQPQPPAK